jgi:hypothetical protein
MGITKYSKGLLTDVVYAVNGGMEDWSYAASWENNFTINSNKPISECKGVDKNMTTYNPDAIKSLMFLIEADFLKIPS